MQGAGRRMTGRVDRGDMRSISNGIDKCHAIETSPRAAAGICRIRSRTVHGPLVLFLLGEFAQRTISPTLPLTPSRLLYVLPTAFIHTEPQLIAPIYHHMYVSVHFHSFQSSWKIFLIDGCKATRYPSAPFDLFATDMDQWIKSIEMSRQIGRPSAPAYWIY